MYELFLFVEFFLLGEIDEVMMGFIMVFENVEYFSELVVVEFFVFGVGIVFVDMKDFGVFSWDDFFRVGIEGVEVLVIIMVFVGVSNC